MRVHRVAESARERAEVSGTKSRSIAGQVERFMDAMTEAVDVGIDGWHEPLRLLLTHTHPSAAVRELHSAMRAAIRRTRYDEAMVDDLMKAIKAVDRRIDLVEFFEPIQLALIVFVGGLSRRPAVLMMVVSDFMLVAEIKPTLAFTLRQPPIKVRSPIQVFKPSATRFVARAVRRTIEAVLEESAHGPAAFADWNEDESIAGLEALWLAYSRCEIGTAGEDVLKVEELQVDLRRCGAPLWRKLGDRLDALCSANGNSKRPEAMRLLSRLMLTLEPSGLDVASSGVGTEPAASANAWLVVCKQPIPESSDKQDKEEIARHRVLETALPVTHLPAAQVLEAARGRLLEEFPWGAAALDVIFDDLIGRANLGVRELTMPATLFVGLPGAGKSRLARRIAEVFDIPRLDVSVGGTSDSKILGGTSRGWAGGRPSDLAGLMARRRCASALVLLDEIDKAVDRQHGGGLMAYLLGLLEPETASRFYDSFLKTECDFSKVSWICTANLLSPLSAPLQSRVRILSLPQPIRDHFPAIARNVIAEMERRWGVQPGVLPGLESLGIDMRPLTSVRQVRSAVEAGITRWSRSILKH